VDVKIENVYLEFIEPDTTVHTITMASADIEAINVSERSDDLLDSVSGKIWNRDGSNKSNIGEWWQVKIYAKLGTDASTELKWHGYVSKMALTRDEYQLGQIYWEAVDFAYHKMTDVTVNESITATDAGQVVYDLLFDYTSGLDLSNINTSTGTDIDATFTDIALLDAIAEVRKKVDFTFWAELDEIWFKARKSIDSTVTITDTDVRDIRLDRDAQQIWNDITVNGATSLALLDSQTTKDAWTTVTSSSRALYKFTVTTESEIWKTILWVDKSRQGGATEWMRLRIQPDDGTGTAPVDATSTAYDITEAWLTNAALATDAESTWEFPRNLLPPDELDFWIIVETDGATGEDIAKDNASGDPYIKIYYRDTLTKHVEDAASKTAYGTRKLPPVENRELKTQDDVDELAAGLLAKYKDPLQTLSFELKTPTPFAAGVGQKMTVNLTQENLSSATFYVQKKDWAITNEYIFTNCNMVLCDYERPDMAADMIKGQTRRIQSLEKSVQLVQTSIGALTVNYSDVQLPPTGMESESTHGNDAHSAEVKEFGTITDPPTGLTASSTHGNAAHAAEVKEFGTITDPPTGLTASSTHGNAAHAAEVKEFGTITDPPTGLTASSTHGNAAHKEIWYPYLFFMFNFGFNIAGGNPYISNEDGTWFDDSSSETVKNKTCMAPKFTDMSQDIKVTIIYCPRATYIAPGREYEIGFWLYGWRNGQTTYENYYVTQTITSVPDTLYEMATFSFTMSCPNLNNANILRMMFRRIGADASDTRNGDLAVFGVLIESKARGAGEEVS